MRINKYLFLTLFFFFTLTSFLSCQENEQEARNIVNKYLKEQLSSNEDEYYKARSYFHPNLAIPGSESARFSVVDSKFSIIRVEKKMMNIDLMEPKNEEITIVTVLFKRYCDIYNNKLIPAKEEYKREYFLSKSTGRLLIIDYSEPWKETVSLGYAINWVKEAKTRSSRWDDLYNKLIELQKKVDQNSK